MITVAEFGMIITLLTEQMVSFATMLDQVYIFTGFTWMDLLVSIAYIEITYEFFLSLVYGDYKTEY